MWIKLNQKKYNSPLYILQHRGVVGVVGDYNVYFYDSCLYIKVLWYNKNNDNNYLETYLNGSYLNGYYICG